MNICIVYTKNLNKIKVKSNNNKMKIINCKKQKIKLMNNKKNCSSKNKILKNKNLNIKLYRIDMKKIKI